MSSKPMAARSRIKLRTRMAGANFRAPATTLRAAATKRGRRQPQPDDFQVTLDLPPSAPILDRELRAIEVLLGRELQDFLARDANDSLGK